MIRSGAEHRVASGYNPPTLNESGIKSLLEDVRAGRLAVEEGVGRLRSWPIHDLGHTRLDTQREMRCGHPEVVYGEGKTPDELADIARAILEHHGKLLVTRVRPEGAARLVAELPRAVHRPRSRTVSVEPERAEGEGLVLVVAAGTSDLPVVAGIHRLLAHEARLREANALVVVAGMEGALPSVVAGLVDRPVIAVPTSVGYGASFGGLAALLAMMNSCAAGVAVVNIDNGFGAGTIAARINRRAEVSSR